VTISSLLSSLSDQIKTRDPSLSVSTSAAERHRSHVSDVIISWDSTDYLESDLVDSTNVDESAVLMAAKSHSFDITVSAQTLDELDRRTDVVVISAKQLATGSWTVSTFNVLSERVPSAASMANCYGTLRLSATIPLYDTITYTTCSLSSSNYVVNMEQSTASIVSGSLVSVSDPMLYVSGSV
jgi:hypothetical protein